jgi:hypothetical protein
VREELFPQASGPLGDVVGETSIIIKGVQATWKTAPLPSAVPHAARADCVRLQWKEEGWYEADLSK